MKRVAAKNFLKVSFLVFLILISIPPILYFYYRRFIYLSVDAVEGGDHSLLVLGAAVNENSYPSTALQERLNLASNLYDAGKVKKIIVSGARDDETYDEPLVMKNELVKLGVPEELIIQDPYGFRTFDSCRNAKEVYNLEEVVVLSQGFHLPRALFLCKSIGIEDSTGVYSVGAFSANYSRWYTVREVFAMYKAVWDVIRY